MKKRFGSLIIVLLLAVAAAGGFIVYKHGSGSPAKNAANETAKPTENDLQITAALDRGASDAFSLCL